MLDETGLPASKFFETDGIGYVSVSFLRKFMAMSKWANDMHPIEPIIITDTVVWVTLYGNCA